MLLACVGSDAFREAFKRSYLTRGPRRTTRRSVSDSVRLGLIARELVSYYVTVVEWSGFRRVIRVDVSA